MLFDWKSSKSWPNFLGKKYFGDETAVSQGYIDKFTNQFTHVRVYHGCRVEDISTYYQYGISSRSHKSLIQWLVTTSRSRFGIEIKESLLQQALSTLPNTCRRKSIFSA